MSEEELQPDVCDVCGATSPGEQTRIFFVDGFPAITCGKHSYELTAATIRGRN